MYNGSTKEALIMHNTIYEQSGGSYTQVGDYLLPDLLPGNEESAVGI